MNESEFLKKSANRPTTSQLASVIRLLISLALLNKWSVLLLIIFASLSVFADIWWTRLLCTFVVALYGMIVGAKFYIDIQPSMETPITTVKTSR
jgi:hypothetical protein